MMVVYYDVSRICQGPMRKRTSLIWIDISEEFHRERHQSGRRRLSGQRPPRHPNPEEGGPDDRGGIEGPGFGDRRG
jgi:hypothetical protein